MYLSPNKGLNFRDSIVYLEIMNMKKFHLFAASTLLALSVNAQEKALKQYGFGDNWFIQGQVGGSYTFSENSSKADLFDVVTPHVALSVGKHFSPIAGARLQVGGWESKTYLGEALDKTYKNKYIQANADALLNLTNLFSTYEGDKAFNLYGILGLGYVHTFADRDIKEADVKTTNTIVPRVGLQADFRLTESLSLNVEATGNLMADRFNGIVGGKNNDATLNLLAGLTYRFTPGGFQTVDVIDPSELSAVNDKVNELQSQLRNKDRQIQEYKASVAGLERKLAEKPAEVVTKGESEVVLNAVVVFRIGSAKLEQNQDINIYNAAKYLQDNKDVNVTVTGYADKSTGTAAINQRLSEQRAKAVADILIKKYGIEANRITTEASGDRVQPFQIDSWNRVVIFTAK